MVRSFLIAAIRNLKKNRLYSIINVLGLALGIACCLVIFVIVKYETSFDDYHSKAERIYRVNLERATDEGWEFYGNNYTPLAEAIRSQVTGLEAVTGVYCLQVYQFSKDENLFEGKYAFFVDQHYMDVFDVAWIAGNPQHALTAPNTAVVTDVFAEKFLGGIAHALGSTFMLENKLTLTVSGIVRNPPTNTDHPYSILISYPTLPEFIPGSTDNWENLGGGATYVVFKENTQKEQVYAQLRRIMDKHLNPELAKKSTFFLMALNDNHDRNYDYSSFTYDFPVPVMVILSIVAGMIAFIACINFVNLATAQSLRRAREVGIRKTIGSSRKQLVGQFMTEAFVITLLAVIVGIGLAKIGMALLSEQFGGYLQLDVLWEPVTLVFIAVITVVISVLAGFYPAIILSGYRPMLALRSHHSNGRSKGFSLRKVLIVVQFAGAQILILVTIIMLNQISHFRNRPISYNPKAVVLFPYLRGNEAQQHARLGNELKNVPGMISYTFSYDLPGGGNPVEFYNKEKEQSKHAGFINYGDTSFIHTYGMKLIAGRNLSVEQASVEVVVNEALMKTLGIINPQEAIGVMYTVNDHEVMIRGVIRDFYTQTMSNRVDPVMVQYDPTKFSGVAMRISTDHITETIAAVEKAWRVAYPGFLCKYQFMDDKLDRAYGFFNTIFTFLGAASFLAIFIGCLGLFGLVSFMAVQRTKEIGIRKVFGATVPNIMMMFTKESAVLIVIAFVGAAPLAHVVGIAMLMELPERVTPGLEIFLVTLLASLFIALLTVAHRAFSAAVQNPTDSLRNE